MAAETLESTSRDRPTEDLYQLGTATRQDNTIRTKSGRTGNAADAAAPFVPHMGQGVGAILSPSAAESAKYRQGVAADAPSGGNRVSGFGRIVLLGAIAATVAGIAGLRAQTQLADPKDAQKIFASTCSACHKSPQGLAKSGQVAGFLRQHYTTGPEMSAAMAAYLVAAGSGPASKKGQAEAKAGQSADSAAAKAKSKKQEAAVQPPADAKDRKDQRTLRGKQSQQAKSQDDRMTAHPSPASAADAAARQAATPAASPAVAETRVEPAPVLEAPPPPLVTLDIPMPEMPTGPPADLTQSVFASSPVP